MIAVHADSPATQASATTVKPAAASPPVSFEDYLAFEINGSGIGREAAIRHVLAAPLTAAEKIEVLKRQGADPAEVDLAMGWAPGTASSLAEAFSAAPGGASPDAVLADIQSGAIGLEEGIRLLHGAGGDAATRLRVSHDLSRHFATLALGPDDYRAAKPTGPFDTSGVWNALLLGIVTPEDAIQTSTALFSPVAMSTPGFGTAASGSGVLDDFDRLQGIAQMPTDIANAINAQAFYAVHGHVPVGTEDSFIPGLAREIPSGYWNLVADLVPPGTQPVVLPPGERDDPHQDPLPKT